MTDNNQNEKAYVYVEAYNGATVKVPVDSLPEWRKAQEALARGDHPPVDEEHHRRLVALMKGEEEPASTHPEKEFVDIIKKGTPQVITPPKNPDVEIKNIFTSKRIAAIFSIILCVLLYFSLLKNVFTEKIDTFIVYTQEGSNTIHGSAECKKKNSDYSLNRNEPIICTTTYHCPDSIWCTRCSDKMVETTITAKNYIVPLHISVAVSSAAFLILAFKKK